MGFETVSVQIDGDVYDRIIEESRAAGTMEADDLQFIIKADATVDGHSGVLVTFTAMIDGKPTRVQATTTGRLVRKVADIVRGVDARRPRGVH